MREFVLALLIPAGLAAQTAPVNLDFEAGALGKAPMGWRLDQSGATGFRATLVDRNCREGKSCVMLSGPASAAEGSFGNLYEVLRAGRYPGRKMRFRAAVRVEGAATKMSLWVRVDGPQGQRSVQNSPVITASQWNYYTIDAEIAPGSDKISFGFVMFGPGKAWVDDVSFEDARKESPEGPRRTIKRVWRA